MEVVKAFNTSALAGKDLFLGIWQVGNSPLPLFIIRFILFIVALSILIWSVQDSCSCLWLLYLTNWSTLLVFMLLATGLKISFCANWAQTSFLCTFGAEFTNQLYEKLYVIAIPLSVLISLLYWLLLYEKDIYDELDVSFAMDMATHVVVPCLAVTELLVTRVPVFMANIWWPVGVGLGYVFMTYCHYIFGFTDRMGNPFIYAILYWEYWKQSLLLVMGSCILLVIIYLAIYCVAYVRDLLGAPQAPDESVDSRLKRMSVFSPIANPNTNPVAKAVFSPIRFIKYLDFSAFSSIFSKSYSMAHKMWNTTINEFYNNLYKCPENISTTSPAPNYRFSSDY